MATSKSGGQPVITNVKTTVASQDIPAMTADLLVWLGEGSRDKLDLRYLLATAYGEVVWGKKDKGGWALSSGASALPAGDLLELRAFGPEDEIFVWRDAAGLKARHRHDRGGEARDTFLEQQLLWGTEPARNGDAPTGFTALVDGDAGLAHSPPLVLDNSHFNGNGHRPARLHVRHYIHRDSDTGIARIVDSRLIGLTAEKAKKEENDDRS